VANEKTTPVCEAQYDFVIIMTAQPRLRSVYPWPLSGTTLQEPAKGRSIRQQGLSDEGRVETQKDRLHCQRSMVQDNAHCGKAARNGLPDSGDYCRCAAARGGVQEDDGLNPLDDVAAFAEKIDASRGPHAGGPISRSMERWLRLLDHGSANKRSYASSEQAGSSVWARRRGG